MKILLTNAFLDLPGGTENWVKTMGSALQKKNHEIYIYSPSKGKFSQHLEEIGFDVWDTFDNQMSFDAAIINHSVCLREIISQRKRSYPLVFTSHGPFEELEKPINGADLYVSVSEETQTRSSNLGFKSILIRNPINTDIYTAKEPTNTSIKNILLVSHRQNKAKIYKKLAKTLKAKLFCIGHKNKKLSYEVYNEINQVDLVLSLGRGCLEAMSCERNVIVAGQFGLDGYIDNNSILELRENNCSGRRYNHDSFTLKDLLEEVNKYHREQGKKNREYILKNNDYLEIAEQYLELINSVN